jgi:hypothetical protein
VSGGGGGIKTLDITGGAPELMEQFRPLVLAVRLGATRSAVSNSGFRVQGSGFRVQGSGSRV